jgi:hypothetical protein
VVAVASKDSAAVETEGRCYRELQGGTQEQWLQQQQLDMFQVLKERKQKRDKRTAF